MGGATSGGGGPLYDIEEEKGYAHECTLLGKEEKGCPAKTGA